jgi:hypothetical protein
METEAGGKLTLFYTIQIQYFTTWLNQGIMKETTLLHSHLKIGRRAGGVAYWYSTCLAHVRPRV